jgi:hypothetical protein
MKVTAFSLTVSLCMTSSYSKYLWFASCQLFDCPDHASPWKFVSQVSTTFRLLLSFIVSDSSQIKIWEGIYLGTFLFPWFFLCFHGPVNQMVPWWTISFQKLFWILTLGWNKCIEIMIDFKHWIKCVLSAPHLLTFRFFLFFFFHHWF